MSPSSSPVPSSSKTTARIVVVLVGLRCFLCADTIGTLEMHHWPSFGPARLHTTPGAPTVAIADWTGLRCARCGGNVYPDEISTTSVHPPVSWDDLERPRRGRPPKLLAAGLLQTAWAGIVVVEARYIKNDSARSRRVLRLLGGTDRPVQPESEPEGVYPLTGTPMSNRPRDLFNLLKAVRHPLSTSFSTATLSATARPDSSSRYVLPNLRDG